jgi:hypothetical protein
VESSLGPGAPLQFAEPVLERRRRPGGPRRRWPTRLAALAIVGAVVVGGLIVLGRSGDSEHQSHPGKGKGHDGSGRSHSASNGSAASEPVQVSLVTRSAMVVCLVPGHGRPLIDSQTLVAGSREGPFNPPADNYRLDLEKGGTLTLKLAGKPQRIHSSGPASYMVDAGGVQTTAFKGSNCR